MRYTENIVKLLMCIMRCTRYKSNGVCCLLATVVSVCVCVCVRACVCVYAFVYILQHITIFLLFN